MVMPALRGQSPGNLGVAVFGLGAMALLVLAHVLFILFLKGAANLFGNARTAQSTAGYLAVYFVSVALNLFQGCLGTIGDPALAILSLALSLVLLVLGIVLLLWFLRLVRGTRDSITAAMNAGRL